MKKSYKTAGTGVFYISIFITLLLFITSALPAVASSPAATWQQTLGGAGNQTGYAIARSGNGFIVAGSIVTQDYDKSGTFLAKIDPNGRIVWQQAYYGGANYGGHALAVLNDGYILAIGTSPSLIRTDQNGYILWQKSFGGNDIDFYYSIIPVSDGYVLAAFVPGPGLWIRGLRLHNHSPSPGRKGRGPSR